ncbi:hypothetical protein JB92DRAFT_1000010 [Gautieria morchelliformis]|nr:hypothetical protein JB92DRAFT_1000010 [Gautieria morchelliformis]
MEIDFTTPSPRSVGQKRARSPASSPPLDRPSKRASGSAGRTPSLPNFQQQNGPHTISNPHPLPSPFFESRTPDDWVVKTGGLKLDSPSFALGHVPLPESERWNVDVTFENADKDAHEVMMTDHDSPTTAEAWPLPSTDNNGSSHFYACSPTRASFQQPAHPAASATPRSDIHIHVQPATPSSRGLPRSAVVQSSPMSMSATNSGAWSSSTTPVRKARVTMGPRPDCEKCRIGVKGHWMHVD